LNIIQISQTKDGLSFMVHGADHLVPPGVKSEKVE